MSTSNSAVVVFTFRPIPMILEEGGSQAWSLNANNARRRTYVVMVRNRYHEGAGSEEHGAAFMVGRLSVVEASPERSDRYILRFDEYAILDPQPVVWPGSRNPVWYLDDIRGLGIDPDALKWQPLREAKSDGKEHDGVISGTSSRQEDGLTFDQARIGLAIQYRVPPESISITITG
jgi:hypothetical protein